MSKIVSLASPCYVENDTRYVFLDGHCCREMQQCYATLKMQLSFPAYFGNNLDALEEVLDDLEWIDEKSVKIVILNSEELLSKEMSKRNVFLEILNTSRNEKIEIIYVKKTIVE